MKEMADHVSATERNSADAERDSKSVKLQAYLLAQLKSGRPERYSAFVTDVRNFGFFVDVSDLGMSGLVPLSSLDDDFYEFDAAKVHVRGRRNRRVIKLGDCVEVEIAKVDTDQKRMDFRLAGPLKEESAKPATRRSARSRQTAQELSEATKKTRKVPKRKARKPADQSRNRKQVSTKRRKPAKNGKNRS
jgi:ribonuclease R